MGADVAREADVITEANTTGNAIDRADELLTCRTRAVPDVLADRLVAIGRTEAQVAVVSEEDLGTTTKGQRTLPTETERAGADEGDVLGREHVGSRRTDEVPTADVLVATAEPGARPELVAEPVLDPVDAGGHVEMVGDDTALIVGDDLAVFVHDHHSELHGVAGGKDVEIVAEVLQVVHVFAEAIDVGVVVVDGAVGVDRQTDLDTGVAGEELGHVDAGVLVGDRDDLAVVVQFHGGTDLFGHLRHEGVEVADVDVLRFVLLLTCVDCGPEGAHLTAGALGVVGGEVGPRRALPLVGIPGERIGRAVRVTDVTVVVLVGTVRPLETDVRARRPGGAVVDPGQVAVLLAPGLTRIARGQITATPGTGERRHGGRRGRRRIDGESIGRQDEGGEGEEGGDHGCSVSKCPSDNRRSRWCWEASLKPAYAFGGVGLHLSLTRDLPWAFNPLDLNQGKSS